MKCRECGRTLISPTVYYADPAAHPGVFPHRGQGLCGRCLNRFRRAGGAPTKGPGVPASYTLAMWEILRSTHNAAEAAREIGITPTAMNSVLYRARKAGDPRGFLNRDSVLLEEWELLRLDNTIDQAARRLGVPSAVLRSAIDRAGIDNRRAS